MFWTVIQCVIGVVLGVGISEVCYEQKEIY